MKNPLRVLLQQRVIPVYRVPFLSALANHPEIELTVFAGQPRPEEMIKTASEIPGANFLFGNNIHLFRGPFYFCFQQGFPTLIEKQKPNILIMEGNARYLSSHQALKKAITLLIPKIGWGLGVPDRSGFFGLPNRLLWERFLLQFDSMLAYSSTGANQYRQLGFSADRVYIAPNATVPPPTHPMPKRPETYINNRPILLYVGRLQERKRLAPLMQICAKLPEKLQPYLWIVGDGPIRTNLENTAAQVYPYTKFFGEKYTHELEEIYKQADLFILPGTGGLAAQQAMAFGLPVIMAAGDGTQANLITPKNGWAIKPQDDDVLLNTLKQALIDVNTLRDKGRAAYQTVKNEVNITQMVDQFIKAIKNTVSAKERT